MLGLGERWQWSGIRDGAKEREGCACRSQKLKKEREAMVGWRRWNKVGQGVNWRCMSGGNV
jgi:hypothetical protein